MRHDSNGHPIGQPLTGHTRSVTAVALGRVGDHDVIVSGSDDNTVRIWHVQEGTLLMVLALLSRARAIELSSDSSALCVGAGHAICLFVVQTYIAENRF
jgi:WD40 repeat protein